MKTTLRILFVGFILTCTTIASAQQVNTLYFLENAPTRHNINPAFQPVSGFYLTLPIIGYTNLWTGTNSWTIADFVFKGPNGSTITPFHPDAPIDWKVGKPNQFGIEMDFNTTILGLGFRIKENGYFHLNISERILVDASLPSSIFQLNKINTVIPTTLSMDMAALIYTDIAVGYSHQIGEKWTVGGKLKVLLGQANLQAKIKDLTLVSSVDSLCVHGTGELYAAAPLHWEQLPDKVDDFNDFDIESLLLGEGVNTQQMIKDFIKPAGMGVALDLGMTYKPVKNLQITASVTDLGFMRWHQHARAGLKIDTTFYGAELNYSDYVVDGVFMTDSISSHISNTLGGYVDALHVSDIEKKPRLPHMSMLRINLNVGVDVNFWKNRIGLGIYSRTRFYNSRIQEEIVLGAAIRPCNWFNIAASYSFINGHWSNIGAAISLAPYDGLMFTVATDYVPLTYAKATTEIGNISLPYKTPGVNLSFGMAIVAGTNSKKKKDKDKDGVYDIFDACPNTPLNVRVDDMGCPVDTDGDGVADYIDECPNTPSAAYGLIDTLGCPLDTDGDGVYDYEDLCPNTPSEAVSHVDQTGCIMDSDNDGIADYIDQCPNTPSEAYGLIDTLGCPLDTDGDGVYDYKDLCPDTPKEALGLVDERGCALDTDKDGVADYCDLCPNTPSEAYGMIDTLGCPIDTDGDGVYDYEDACPTVSGTKANNGCPEVRPEVRRMLKEAMAGVEFDNGKATIKPSSYALLDSITGIMLSNPTYKIEVQGHTDNVGQYDYNMDLSDRRAHAVRTYMVNKGVPAGRLTAKGYGPNIPIADNTTTEGRAKNHRIEFAISFEDIAYDSTYVDGNN